MRKIFLMITVCIFLCGCQRPVVSSAVSSLPPEEAEMPDETIEKIDDEEIKLPEVIQEISNEGKLQLETVSLSLADGMDGRDVGQFDEYHWLYFAGRLQRDTHNNVVGYTDARLFLFDRRNGEIAAECPIEEDLSGYVLNLHYYDDGCVLFSYSIDDNGQPLLHYAYDLRYAHNTLNAQSIEFEIYPYNRKRIVSPDGNYTVYAAVDSGSGYGGIDLQSPDGTTERILSDVSDEYGIQSVTGYTPVEFLDNTTLLYTIGGWEWSKGYGLYDVETGEKRIYPAEKGGIEGVYGCADGYLYGYASSGYLTSKIWQIAPDGEERLIASMEEADGVFLLPAEEGTVSLWFQDGFWILCDETEARKVREEQGGDRFREMLKNGTLHIVITVYSADFGEILAEVSLPYGDGSARLHVSDEYFRWVIPGE